jgi:arabinofuranosyltransferase
MSEEVWAGLNYFWFTFKFDTLTWVAILAAFITSLWSKRRPALLVSAGMLLYLLYILQIGGDFMGGRFLSSVYLAAVIILLVVLFPALSSRQLAAGLAAAGLLSLLASSPPYLLYAKGYQTARWQGVVDERMVYSRTNLIRIDALHEFNRDPQYTLLNKAAYLARGLWRGTLWRLEPEHDWIELGREIRAQAAANGSMQFLPQGANGFTGYYAGPDVYFIHGLALTDGLLARVPPIYNPNWRSGHFMRLILDGYLEVEAGEQQHLADAQLDAYYQKIRTVTHGPLFTAERWQAIWELNTREFADWLPGYADDFRFPGLQSADIEVAPTTEQVVDLAFAGQGSAAQINFAARLQAASLQLTTSAGDNFDLVFLDESGGVLGEVRLLSQQASGQEIHSVNVPDAVIEAGFASIRLEPVRVLNRAADGDYLLYSLLVTDN